MNKTKTVALVIAGYLLSMQQAFAIGHCEDLTLPCPNGAVPEIDGSGAIIAIGLVAGIVALVRERFFRK